MTVPPNSGGSPASSLSGHLHSLICTSTHIDVHTYTHTYRQVLMASNPSHWETMERELRGLPGPHLSEILSEDVKQRKRCEEPRATGLAPSKALFGKFSIEDESGTGCGRGAGQHFPILQGPHDLAPAPQFRPCSSKPKP